MSSSGDTPRTHRGTIPGLACEHSCVQRTDVGWIAETWHRGYVQHNLARFERRGVTLGVHAEPWDRLVTLATGSMFCAWVDLRRGPSFGRIVTHELHAGSAVFIPRGVGDSFQVLDAPAVTSTLLSERWTPEARSHDVSVDPFDSALQIQWPIPPSEAIRPDGPTYLRLSEISPWHEPDGKDASAGTGAPFKVLFVCTANICRSAYADVTSRAAGIDGVEFTSAGTHALVGEGIDPPMAHQLAGRGNPAAHKALQLTRQLMEEADLVLAMASRHRRYILDEWPALGRKTYLIGHAARVMESLPDDVTSATLIDHLWANRTSQPGDEVADPYGRGQEAAHVAARQIDGDLEVILPVLRDLVADRF